MGDFEHKILSMLTEATATDDFPASFSKDVSQADNPKAQSVDKKWPVEGKVEDDDMDVVAEDDKPEDDVDDEPKDVMKESDDDDEDDVVDADDDDVEFDDDDEEDDEEDDEDTTFSEMIARLREAPDDPEKPEGEVNEEQDGEVGKTEPKEEPFQESRKTKVKVKESKTKTKKKVTEGEVPDAFKKNWEKGDDKDEVKEGEMPDFLKKKLDKDGDGEPDVKESLTVKEADGDDDDLKKDTDAMFGGEDLPEAFRQKASLVFEAAVKTRAAAARKRCAEEATAKLKEAYDVLKKKSEARIAATEKKLSEHVDQYLTYVAGEWMKENRLAVEAGLRMELAEDFINGLKKLFVEHYIEVPKSKVDVVKLMGKKLSKMESRVNEQAKENVKLRESINRYRREDAIRAASKGLTEVQADKLRKVSENVTFTSREQFASALTTLKESYFPKEKPKGTLMTEETKKAAPVAPAAPAAEPISEEIDVYVKALNKKR